MPSNCFSGLAKYFSAFLHKPVRTVFASTKEHFWDAFSLIYEQYYRHGFIPFNEKKIFFTPYLALPESRVCIGYSQQNIPICTSTIVIDSELGLPSDSTFNKELNLLRKQNRKLAEITCLASKERSFFPSNLFPVWKLLYHYSKTKKVTDIVVSIRPKHRLFYERFLCFEPVSGLKTYKGVYNNVPVILEKLDLRLISKKLAKSKKSNLSFVSKFFMNLNLVEIFEISKFKNMDPEIFWFFFIKNQKIFPTLPPAFQALFSLEYDLILYEEKTQKAA